MPGTEQMECQRPAVNEQAPDTPAHPHTPEGRLSAHDSKGQLN